jgi:hypothetical protein
MKNAGELIAYTVAVLWMIFFFRIVWINHTVVKYLKNNHKIFWESNFQYFGGVGKGGPNIFKFLEKLDDPQIGLFRTDWLAAVRQFLIIVAISICVIAGYIYLLSSR